MTVTEANALAPWRDELKVRGIGYYVADAGGCFTYCNPTVASTTGFSVDELLGTRAVDLVIASEREAVSLQYRAWAMDPQVSDAALEMRVVAKDGRTFWVEQFTHFERDATGALLRYNNFLRDITWRMQAEERWRTTEGRYQRVVEAIRDALIVVDFEGRLYYANDRFLDLTGFAREELSALSMADYVAPEYLAELRARHARRLAGQPQRDDVEGEMLRKDGSRVWVSAYVTPIFTDGTLTGTQWLIRDITDRREADQRLAESERRFRAVFDESPTAMVLADPETFRFVFVNAAVQRVFGYQPEEIVGRHGVDLRLWVHPEQRGELLAEYRAGGTVSEREVQFHRADGTVFDALFSSRSVAVGDRNYVLYSVVDVTVTRRAQADLARAVDALRGSVSLLEATLESTADGILVVANDRSIARFNHRFAEMWRLPRDILESRDDARALDFVLSQLRDPAGFIDTVERLYASPEAESMDLLEFTDERVFERYSRPQVVDGQTVGRVWSFRDVTERRRAEAAQRQLEAGLQRAQKLEAVGTLAGGIAHDFNNILTAIIASAEQSAMELPSDHEVQESLMTILQAGQRAASLVRRILLFSRGEVGARSVVRMDQVIRDAMGLLRPTLPASVEIVANLAVPGEDLRIQADPAQVQQVLVNLCTNAWHAMRARGGGRITIEARDLQLDSAAVQREGLTLAPGKYVRVTVADTGAGIPEEVLPRIFDPFFTTKPVGEGTGLGLAMVHGIMRGHEGDVSVSSRVGEGTAFRLYFPVGTPGPDAPAAPAAVPRGQGQRVLLVDDEPSVCAVEQRTLEYLGYQVVTATSGEAALAVFLAHPEAVDLLLTDLTMPGMTGIELTRQARRVRPGLPVVLCTGYAGTDTEAQVKAMQINVLLAKPHTIRELAEAVARALPVAVAADGS